MTDWDRIVPRKQAAALTGIPERTIREWQRKGAVARHTDPGGKKVRVDLDELRPRPKPPTGDAAA